MKCETCIHYSLYQMIYSGRPYSYSGEIPCLACMYQFDVYLKDNYEESIQSQQDVITKRRKEKISIYRKSSWH